MKVWLLWETCVTGPEYLIDVFASLVLAQIRQRTCAMPSRIEEREVVICWKSWEGRCDLEQL